MFNSKYKLIGFICCAFVCAFLGLYHIDTVKADTLSISYSYKTNPNLDTVSTTSISYSGNGPFYVVDFENGNGYAPVIFSTSSFSRNPTNAGNYFSANKDGVTLYFNILGYSTSYPVSSTFVSSSYTSKMIHLSNFDRTTIQNYIFDHYQSLIRPEPELDKNLGYIDVTRSAFLDVKGEKFLSFNFSSNSSTNVPITGDGFYLRIYGACELRYVGHTYRDIYYITGRNDTNLFPCSAQQYLYSFNQFINEHGEHVREGLQRANGGIFGLMPDGLQTYTFDYLVQIYDTNSNTVGPWLDIHYDLRNPDAPNIVTRPGHLDPDSGEVIFDDPITGDPTDDPDNTDVPNGEGEGDTIPDADDNAKDNTPDPNGGGLPDPDNLDLLQIISNIKSAIKSFFSAIEGFVGLVRVTFSYLPSWALDFFGLAFVIWCIMIIKRSIF